MLQECARREGHAGNYAELKYLSTSQLILARNEKKLRLLETEVRLI